MKNNIVVLGDWIADVYVGNKNIQQNQEIINKDSYKGYYDGISVYPGGAGFLIDNLLKLVGTTVHYKIKYLLPNFDFINYDDSVVYAFNVHELFDRSIKYLYNNRCCDNFNIIKMQPIDYISDIIEPTVKMRFFSKNRKEIFYRFDRDNSIQLRNINCDHLFGKFNNILCLIDYDKGYLTEESIISLYDYLNSNFININTLFLNTKPHKLKLFKDLLSFLHEKFDCKTIIQLNEFEYEPIKDELNNYEWAHLIVTRGTKDIYLYNKHITINHESIDISHTIVSDVITTSGCGDLMLSGIIYNYLYNGLDIKESIIETSNRMKHDIIELNNKIFIN